MLFQTALQKPAHVKMIFKTIKIHNQVFKAIKTEYTDFIEISDFSDSGSLKNYIL